MVLKFSVCVQLCVYTYVCVEVFIYKYNGVYIFKYNAVKLQLSCHLPFYSTLGSI